MSINYKDLNKSLKDLKEALNPASIKEATVGQEALIDNLKGLLENLEQLDKDLTSSAKEALRREVSTNSTASEKGEVKAHFAETKAKVKEMVAISRDLVAKTKGLLKKIK